MIMKIIFTTVLYLFSFHDNFIEFENIIYTIERNVTAVCCWTSTL